MRNQRLLANLIAHSPSSAATNALMVHCDLEAEYFPLDVRSASGGWDAPHARATWKAGRCHATVAQRVALLTSDAALLQDMAAKEKRMGVLTKVVHNPSVPLEALVFLRERLSWRSPASRELTVTRTHQVPLSGEMVALACSSWSGSYVQVGCATHPSHTTESLLDLLDVPSKAASWRELIAARCDLLDHGAVLDALVAPEQQTPGVVAELVSRTDLASFPLHVLRILAVSSLASYLSDVEGLPVEIYELMVASADLSLPNVAFSGDLGENMSVPTYLLRGAPVHAGMGSALARLLEEAFPGEAAPWEILAGLVPSLEKVSCGEVVDMIRALHT